MTTTSPSSPSSPSTATASFSSPLSVASRALSVPIWAYQAARAGRPSPCRYWPTCSNYALEALATRGALPGGWLAVRRLLRCHPWAATSGVDPVPPARSEA